MAQRVLPLPARATDASLVPPSLRPPPPAPVTPEWARRCIAGLDRFVRNSFPRGQRVTVASVAGNPDRPRPVVAAGALLPDTEAAAAGWWGGQSVPPAPREGLGHRSTADGVAAAEGRAQQTLNSIGDAVVATDLACRVTFLNAVAEKLTGWSRDDANGLPIEQVFRIVEAATRERMESPVVRAILEGRTVHLTPHCLLISRDGTEIAIEDSASPIRGSSGDILGGVIVFRDVSAARARAERLDHLVHHDGLTDVANRLLVNDRLTQAVALAHRERRQVALLFVDVDHFKSVNDSLGHPVGDRLLRSVAQRLRSCIRHSDTVGRFGGDEFVVLLPEVAQARDAIVTAEAILRAFDRPHQIDDRELNVSVSIGIATFPQDGADAEALLGRADLAMYRAKAAGRNTYMCFADGLVPEAAQRTKLTGHVVRAIERQDLVLHYQPTISLATRAVTGVEALLRWRHPTRGLVLPRDFIPRAEKQGVIVAIGRWALREACRQGQAWQDACLLPMRIAVNVSATELRGRGFVANVEHALKTTGLGAQYLELEVTEQVLLQNSRSTGEVLRALKDLGVRLALDDFGTGLVSLAHLGTSAIDIVKVDRSLVLDVMTDPDDARLVGAVISMADSLCIPVVAEGVETAEQVMFLQEQSCAEAQGFYFSPPLPADEMTVLLWQSQSDHAPPLPSRRDPVEARVQRAGR